MESLRRIRKEKGLTQKSLGEKVDVSESMIGMIENGARNPSFELLLKLGEALDCSVDDLLRGEKSPPPLKATGLCMSRMNNGRIKMRGCLNGSALCR